MTTKLKNAMLWWVLSICLFAGVLGAHFFLRAQFNRGCTDHFTRAAAASTIDLADSEMALGLKYLEDHDLTAGNTALFYQAPADDIGFWYRNLKAAEDVLRKVPKDSSPLERANVLLKLKESIVPPPGSIELYPDQRSWNFWLLLVFAVFMFLGGRMLSSLP